MSFGINADVKVFSKSAGKRTDLWGVEVHFIVFLRWILLAYCDSITIFLLFIFFKISIFGLRLISLSLVIYLLTCRSLFQINGKRGFAPKTFLKEYKVLKQDLSHEVPVYNYNNKAKKVEPKKLESTKEENSKSHTSLKDKLSQNDNETPSLQSIDKSTIEDPRAINADSTSPLYEVIDGTTVYFENDPSVQPSFVSEVAHATALPNEQVTVAPNSEINQERLLSDTNTFINSKESGMGDTSNNEGIQLSIDTQKEISSDIENPEAIISSTGDTVNGDILASDENNVPKELLENVEHMKELNNSTEENAKDKEKEKVTEYVESDGIFASIKKTFNILSNLEETVTTESTTTQNSDDTAAPKIAVDNNPQSEEQVSENIGVKDPVTEEILPPIEIKLESNVDQSFIDKEKIETQEEIIHESIENAEVSDEKMKEASTIILENTASFSDVPSSNNFVLENADKPAKELPTVSSNLADDNSAPVKADADNIQVQKASETEKVMEDMRTDAITSDKQNSTILSNLQESVANSIQSSDDIEQKLSENNKTLENIKDHKETIGQNDKIVIAEISEIIDSPPETTEHIAIESVSESHSVTENIAITEETLNSAADIQFNEEFIVHSNVNKNDNLVNDTSSDNVPIESNEFSNSPKSNVLGPEQSVDSSQESVISEQTMTLSEILKKRDLLTIKENFKHRDSKLLIN